MPCAADSATDCFVRGVICRHPCRRGDGGLPVAFSPRLRPGFWRFWPRRQDKNFAGGGEAENGAKVRAGLRLSAWQGGCRQGLMVRGSEPGSVCGRSLGSEGKSVREVLEFRVPEQNAREHLLESDGVLLGDSVRKVAAERGSALCTRILDLDRQYKSESAGKRSFYLGWDIRRTY